MDATSTTSTSSSGTTPTSRVVAFTAAQIPGIADRRYPAVARRAALPGRDPDPRRGGARLADPRGACGRGRARLLGPLARRGDAQGLGRARRRRRLPAARARSGRCSRARSPSSRSAPSARAAGRARPAVASAGSCATRDSTSSSSGIRCRTATSSAMRVQRFASLADIDAAHPTIEEREEYEASVEAGLVVYAGVDYAEILELAEEEADLIVWDGGNNDLPFFRPDLLIVVVDPLRAGHELALPPGRDEPPDGRRGRRQQGGQRRPGPGRAGARGHRLDQPGRRPSSRRTRRSRSSTAPRSSERRCSSSRTARRSRTAGCRSAQAWSPRSAAEQARSSTRGRTRSGRSQRPTSATRTSARCSPRWATRDEQLHELEQTINAADCDVVVSATPIDLTRLIDSRHPMRHATYELRGDREADARRRARPDRRPDQGGRTSLPRTALG